MTVLVEITKTSRGMGAKAERSIYDRATHRFDSIASARAWVKEHYGKKPASLIYVDTKSRGTIHCGWIYSGKDCDDRGALTWQDWVSFSRIISEDDKTAESIDLDAPSTS